MDFGRKAGACTLKYLPLPGGIIGGLKPNDALCSLELFFFRFFAFTDMELLVTEPEVYLIISVSDGNFKWSSRLAEVVCGMLRGADEELDALADVIDVVLVVLDRPLDPCESIS